MCSIFANLLDLDAPMDEQTEIAIRKLHQCEKTFDFSDPLAQFEDKEVCFNY
jgi:hypothetical protein